MNDTAQKLRDITQNAGVTPGSGKPYSVIAAIKSAFGFDSILAAGVLLQFMAAIADELDELQAKANDANNLRQKLDSAEKKAERRKKQVEHTEDAIRERNARLKMRAELLEQAVNENRELRKQVPTGRERQILAMWPRFEDGEYVWFRDSVEHGGATETVQGFKLYRSGPAFLSVVGVDTEKWLRIEDYESVKRPARSVLDADGVEIKVGDTVWYRSLSTGDRMRKATVTGFGEHSLDGPLATLKDEAGGTWHIDPKKITHARPDSWKRIVEDMQKSPCAYFGYLYKDCDEGDGCPANESVDCRKVMTIDIICRAKALAGVEVA
ncbi:coiled-coil domain-containing protein [Collinsella intestinalis]|uniref:coiled-coil domain-containing protein n=1 Tax=Collinsella intestinalis TaxID=147207 RepID=UPI0022E5217A|nr:hypothetical protein [Collinsella intestinalis]